MTVERAEETQPTGTADDDAAPALESTQSADPSPEAAIGSSGDRALGGAAELADQATAAVDSMVEARGAGTGDDMAASEASAGDGAPPGDTATGDTATTGETAPAATTEAASDTAPAPGTDGPTATATVLDAAQADAAQATGTTAADDTAPVDDTAHASDGATDTVAPGDTAPATDVTAATSSDATDGAATAELTDGAVATAAPLAGDGVPPEELEQAPAAEPAAEAAPRPEPTTMEELLNEQTGDIRSFKHGDVVEGAVVRIDKDEILVDIGAKSEGVVSNRELYGRNAETQPQLTVGDTVLVYVLQPESEQGHAVLSLRRAGLERKWRAMQEQFDAGVIIEAPVIDHNKGGLIVDCGIRGFVPISQIVDFPRRPQNEQPRDAAQEIAEKLQPFVGRRLRLKILEVNRKANRLILSEKVALYEERREKRDELFSSLKVGQRVTGNVRSIAPFGVFVDLGGIDGLVHKSELSWNKVNNPENGYKVGEEVEAEVIDINHERGRISLSIRRLQPDPWHSTVADLKAGDLIEGTVTKIVNFGAFVRVREGLEGLIHISELSHQRVAHPGDVVHEGQRLKLKIISLDSERHRLGLSLKQAEEAPARPPMEAPQARERRPRPERAYDPSQAVQEPEGGIDNTLAAAFAQVRQQMQEQDRADATDAGGDGAGGDGAAESDDAVADELRATADTSRLPEAETADAPALQVAPSASASTPTDEVPVAEAPGVEAAAGGSEDETSDSAAVSPEATAVGDPADEAGVTDAPAAEAAAAAADQDGTGDAPAGEVATADAVPAEPDAAATEVATTTTDAASATDEPAGTATADLMATGEATGTDEPDPTEVATTAAATDDTTSSQPDAGAAEDTASDQATPTDATEATGGDEPTSGGATATEQSAQDASPGDAEAGPEGSDDRGSREPAEGAPEAAPGDGADTER